MRIKHLFFGMLMLLALASCRSSKYIYLEDMPVDKPLPITHKSETRIKPADRLAIHVTCKNQELAVPFNSPSYRVGQSGETAITDNLTETGYLVDDEGFINFSILGKLHVAGLTMPQASEYITNLLVEGKHIPDAVVETRITNFTIYSLGGLSPRKLVVPEGKINILQAVAQMGDLQDRAKIQKVRVIREDDGQRMEFDIDMTTTALYDSPAFYLQQNDIVYAEPRKRSNASFERTIRSITLLSVLASIAYTVAYIMK